MCFYWNKVYFNIIFLYIVNFLWSHSLYDWNWVKFLVDHLCLFLRNLLFKVVFLQYFPSSSFPSKPHIGLSTAAFSVGRINDRAPVLLPSSLFRPPAFVIGGAILPFGFQLPIFSYLALWVKSPVEEQLEAAFDELQNGIGPCCYTCFRAQHGTSKAHNSKGNHIESDLCLQGASDMWSNLLRGRV